MAYPSDLSFCLPTILSSGRSTSASLALPLSGQTRRPKSSIPTFHQIEERVSRQEEVNPDWDPNTELPIEPEKDGEHNRRPALIENNWIFDSKPNTPAAKYAHLHVHIQSILIETEFKSIFNNTVQV